MFILVLGLIANTVQGIVWLTKIKKEDEDYLKTGYYVESIVLLSIPLAIASFFVVVLFVVIGILILEHRRNFNRMRRLEDEGFYDFEEIEEIAETYMRMLEQVTYSKDIHNYNECVICLKEFEEQELVHKIPNC